MNFSSKKYFFLFLFGVISDSMLAQPQNSKWYFGSQAGLDFMTNPPTVLTNGTMTAGFGCASQADATGNLLFYTDGETVYNSSHAIMANGTGLFGTNTPVQPCLVCKKPGSPNLHYIFTVVGDASPGGLNYSIADMTLAAGLGSVTAKNYSLYPGICDEKITGALHCNGTDFWILVHQEMSNNFRAYLLTATGVSTTAVVSSVGPANLSAANKMKISPSGNKLATTTVVSGTMSEISLFDFDNTSGVVSNYQSLYTGLYNNNNGIEFSPDGSKLYCSDDTFGPMNSSSIHQWDLCAGLLPAIAASHYTVANLAISSSYQLANNGKIYLSQNGLNSLGVINNPNIGGPSCNYVSSGQTLGTKFSTGSLPNFVNRYRAVLSPFSNSVITGQACRSVSFAANLPIVTCASPNYSVVSLSWNFGDPTTGTLNVSNLATPIHIYSSSGTYTTTLIFYYKCSSDTLLQTVYVPPPDLAVSSSSNCSLVSSATAAVTGGVGPYTYSWMPGSQAGPIVSNLTPGQYTITAYDAGLSCTVFSVISIASIVAPVMSLTPSNGNISICSGSQSTIQLSGNVSSFAWVPSAGLNINGNVIFVNSLIPQIYTISGVFNSCNKSTTLQVNVNPLPVPKILINKNVLCINDVLQMNGSGGYQYQWVGPEGFTSALQQFSTAISSTAAAGAYTLTITDLNGCRNATTANVTISPSTEGVLQGFKSAGCAPLCSEYNFEGNSRSSPVVSTWEIEGNRFNGHFTYCFAKGGNFVIKGVLQDTMTKCSANTSYSVNVFERPEADFIYLPNYPIADIEDVKFINNSIGEDQVWWAWSFNGFHNIPFVQNIYRENVTKNFTHSGIYVGSLVVTNRFGCSDTIIKSIVVNDDFTLYVPNAFTPNDDLLNDFFLPIIRSVKTFTLKIFNRWGAQIFSSQIPGEGWDGMFNGEPVEAGTYIWTINYTRDRGEGVKRSGTVLLSR